MAKYPVKALTFDLFGTILDLGGSLIPHLAKFLAAKKGEVSPAHFWELWRYRQRIEQYQNNILMLGHSGYLETARRAFVFFHAKIKASLGLGTTFTPTVTVIINSGNKLFLSG